jgi:hypothetical protein
MSVNGRHKYECRYTYYSRVSEREIYLYHLPSMVNDTTGALRIEMNKKWIEK